MAFGLPELSSREVALWRWHRRKFCGKNASRHEELGFFSSLLSIDETVAGTPRFRFLMDENLSCPPQEKFSVFSTVSVFDGRFSLLKSFKVRRDPRFSCIFAVKITTPAAVDEVGKKDAYSAVEISTPASDKNAKKCFASAADEETNKVKKMTLCMPQKVSKI